MTRPRASVVGSAILLAVTTALATPIVAQMLWALSRSDGRAALQALSLDWVLLLRTILVTATIGVGATLLAWPAAWWARSERARFRALLILPMVLPSYFLTSSYTLLRAPGTLAGDLILQSTPAAIRTVVLSQVVLMMVLWSWPIATFVLWVAIGLVPRDQLEALRLSSARSSREILQRARLLRGGILTSILVVTLIMAGSAVPLHIANLPTYAIEVWRQLNEHSSSAPAWGMSVPLVVTIALLSALLVTRLRPKQLDINTLQPVPGRWTRRLCTWGIWLLAVVVPVCAIVFSGQSLSKDAIDMILRTSAPPAFTSLLGAAGVLAVSLLIGLLASVSMVGGWDSLSSRITRASL
ncbi:MAG: ABC transporter permease family protein, partial [Planctomycetota bacterium]